MPVIFSHALGLMGWKQCCGVFQGENKWLKFAHMWVIATEFVYIYIKMRRHEKCTLQVSTWFMSLSFAVMTWLYWLKKSNKIMNTSTHNICQSSSRWKLLHLQLSRINKLGCDFLHWQVFHLFAPRETMWHCFYPITLYQGVERRWVSWIRSIAELSTLNWPSRVRP